MLRLAPLLLLLLTGCQRPVAVVLTYAPAPTAAEAEEAAPVDMNRAVSVVEQRLRASGIAARVSLDESRNVRVEVFDDDQELLDRIDRIVTALGTFELRILANSHDHAALIEQARATDEGEVRDEQGKLLGWWAALDDDMEKNILALPDATTRTIQRDGASEMQLLVVNDPYRVDGSRLVRVAPGIDQNGRPNVFFQFNQQGGQMLAGLTTDNLPDADGKHYRHLAIILNGRVRSAPRIQSTIRERGEITGNFTRQEVEELVNVLGSGRSPTPLKRVNIEHLGEGP